MADDADRDRALKDAFEKAARAEQDKAKREEAEKAQSSKREGTSFARTLGKTPLDRAGSSKGEFDRAAAGEQRAPEEKQDEKGRAKRPPPAPQMHLRPDGSIRRAVDAGVAREQEGNEAADLELKREFEARLKQQKLLDLEKNRDDTDRDDRSR